MAITYQILVSNNSNMAKAEIVDIFTGGHVFSINESMQVFLANGGLFDSWGRVFSLVKGTDRSFEEVQYLLDYNEVGDRKYFFVEPPRESQIWQDLYFTGETTQSTSLILENLGVR